MYMNNFDDLSDEQLLELYKITHKDEDVSKKSVQKRIIRDLRRSGSSHALKKGSKFGSFAVIVIALLIILIAIIIIMNAFLMIRFRNSI